MTPLNDAVYDCLCDGRRWHLTDLYEATEGYGLFRMFRITRFLDVLLRTGVIRDGWTDTVQPPRRYYQHLSTGRRMCTGP